MSYINHAGRLIFNAVVREGTGIKETHTRLMKVGVIVMSEETAREIMREDYGQTVFRRALVKTEPDRCYGIRVAYDRSMTLGEMMVGEVTRGESPT